MQRHLHIHVRDTSDYGTSEGARKRRSAMPQQQKKHYSSFGSPERSASSSERGRSTQATPRKGGSASLRSQPATKSFYQGLRQSGALKSEPKVFYQPKAKKPRTFQQPAYTPKTEDEVKRDAGGKFARVSERKKKPKPMGKKEEAEWHANAPRRDDFRAVIKGTMTGEEYEKKWGKM